MSNIIEQGTQLDAVVLVINPYDEQEYVEHTIQYLESFGFCKVIAIYLLGDEDDMSNLFTCIIYYFS